MSNLHLKDNPTLADLQQYVRDLVIERKFDDGIPDKIMMLAEEVGELAKASRKMTGMKMARDAAEQNVADEAADILIVLLGLCNLMDIDLEEAVRVKEEKNKQRVWE